MKKEEIKYIVKYPKRYRFLHFKNVEALISYPQSKEACILVGKERIVLCFVSRESIEKSKSWQLIK